MAKYRVKETSFIDNRLVREGEIIEFEGEASDNLEKLTKAQAKEADEQADQQ